MNALNLVQGDVITSPVIELRGAGAGMVGHGSRALERPAILQIRGDTSRPERVIADPGRDAGPQRPALNHRPGIGLG